MSPSLSRSVTYTAFALLKLPAMVWLAKGMWLPTSALVAEMAAPWGSSIATSIITDATKQKNLRVFMFDLRVLLRVPYPMGK